MLSTSTRTRSLPRVFPAALLLLLHPPRCCFTMHCPLFINAPPPSPSSILPPRQGCLGRPVSTSVVASASSQHEDQEEEQLRFGPYKLYPSQVFYRSKTSLGIVNLKPIVPGHVLVISKRVVPRLADLTPEEVSDLYCSVHHMGPILEAHYAGEALTVSMQDGQSAGQSVPHVHVHVLPRRPGDFKRNDQVYDELDGQCLDRQLDLDEDRRSRSRDEMAQEAAQLRTLFPSVVFGRRCVECVSVISGC